MAEWQERVQSMIIGFVFAYMVVKLFAVVANFRAGNLRVERASTDEPTPLAATSEAEVETETDPEPRSSSSSSDEEEEEAAEDTAPVAESKVESKEEIKNEEGVEKKAESEEETGVGAFEEETGAVTFQSEGETGDGVFEEETGDGVFEEETGDGVFEEETGGALEDEEEVEGDEKELEDWEGVESTELEKLFGAASTFADKIPSSEASLQLHAFYKIATEGPCSSSQPSAFQPTARAKWNAWQKLGNMSQEEAMQKYIAMVTQINPNWYEDYRKSKEARQQKREDVSVQRTN